MEPRYRQPGPFTSPAVPCKEKGVPTNRNASWKSLINQRITYHYLGTAATGKQPLSPGYPTQQHQTPGLRTISKLPPPILQHTDQFLQIGIGHFPVAVDVARYSSNRWRFIRVAFRIAQVRQRSLHRRNIGGRQMAVQIKVAQHG